MTTFSDPVDVLKNDLSSRAALEACVSGMSSDGRLGDHAAREIVYLAAKRQRLSGLELVDLLLKNMDVRYGVEPLHRNHYVCSLTVLGYKVSIEERHLPFKRTCSVDAISEDSTVDYGFVAGRRLLIDFLMDPSSHLPPPGGPPTAAWRTAQIERFVYRAREIGLEMPPVNEERLGETHPLGINFGDAFTNVRGGESLKWSTARFRVVHRGLVYRCRFINSCNPDYDPRLLGPDFVECDPRFATAPSGSVRYVAPPPSCWGLRGGHRPRLVTPFGHLVNHVSRGDTKWVIQTPYDLRSAIRRYSSAWKAGPQRSPTDFMRLVKRLGMGDWFNIRPVRMEGDNRKDRFWCCRYERFGCSLNISFHEQPDGMWKARLQFTFAEMTTGLPPVWIKTPRRFYEVVRDSLWIGSDGREEYRPGSVPSWIAAMREKRPEDDGVG